MNMKYTHEAGRSMIEMLGVLAIIGVLSVGGIQGYSMAMSKFKVSKTTDQVQTMVTNIRTLFAGQRTYAGLDSKTAYTMGIFNDEICNDSTCAKPVNPYGGTIVLGSPNENQYFSITYNTLSTDACTRLAMADWGDASSGLVAIALSGAAQAVPTTWAHVDASQGKGTFTTAKGGDVPITLAHAVLACKPSSGDNTSSITWIYR